MTIAGRTAITDRKPHNGTRPALLCPGRTVLALTINWRQAALEAMVHELKVARGLEEVKDSIRIAELRQLANQCSMALTRCRMERDAA